MSATNLGIVYAITSAIFNGSFTTLFKTRRMVDLSISPIIFQLYVSCGVFVSSWFVVPFIPMEREDGLSFCMGLIAGALFVFSVFASFQAVDYVGVALAQGVWGGVAMVVSYAWGVFLFDENPSNQFLSLFSLFLLVCGVLLIAFCERVGKFFVRNSFNNNDSESNLLLDTNNDDDNGIRPSLVGTQLKGMLWALFVGTFGGSILAPMHYAHEQGLIFLPSFGCSAILTAPMVLIVHMLYTRDVPAFHWKDALLPGVISGFIYNAGNALSMVAISYVGYSVAYPILQGAILVSGIWGIYLFKEITHRNTIRVFFVGGITLLLGALLLALSHNQQ